MEYALDDISSARNLCERTEYLAEHNEEDDSMMDEYIEERRQEFYEEWFKYIEQYE